MKVAKRFRWEAAHRLPTHEGECRFLHGHSYRMLVVLNGEKPDARGMLLDFKELKRILHPLISAWDHATLVAGNDTELLRILEKTGWKYAVLPNETTSENLCTYVADFICSNARDLLLTHRITSVQVRIEETETSFAEVEQAVTPA